MNYKVACKCLKVVSKESCIATEVCSGYAQRPRVGWSELSQCVVSERIDRELLCSCSCAGCAYDRRWQTNTWKTWHQLCVAWLVDISKKRNKLGSREEFTGNAVL